ncbi:MAG: PIN domain-containing protein [Candidatus Aminicenantes bacterium]|nr:PIN domain-containing protein [Candidatus Aminicenantes bacterium]
MTTCFVDTNVFLRFLTLDDEGHHAKAVRLFESAARGERRLVTGPPVLFELAWTLRAAYKAPRAQVLEILKAVFATPGLTLTDASLVADTLTLASATDSEFADAYIAAASRSAECSEVATFNRKDFAKLGIELAEL